MRFLNAWSIATKVAPLVVLAGCFTSASAVEVYDLQSSSTKEIEAKSIEAFSDGVLACNDINCRILDSTLYPRTGWVLPTGLSTTHLRWLGGKSIYKLNERVVILDSAGKVSWSRLGNFVIQDRRFVILLQDILSGVDSFAILDLLSGKLEHRKGQPMFTYMPNGHELPLLLDESRRLAVRHGKVVSWPKSYVYCRPIGFLDDRAMVCFNKKGEGVTVDEARQQWSRPFKPEAIVRNVSPWWWVKAQNELGSSTMELRKEPEYSVIASMRIQQESKAEEKTALQPSGDGRFLQIEKEGVSILDTNGHVSHFVPGTQALADDIRVKQIGNDIYFILSENWIAFRNGQEIKAISGFHDVICGNQVLKARLGGFWRAVWDSSIATFKQGEFLTADEKIGSRCVVGRFLYPYGRLPQ